MNFTAAPVPVSFPNQQKSRRARRPGSVGEVSQNDLSIKGGTPCADSGRNFPLPLHPAGTGRPQKKRFLGHSACTRHVLPKMPGVLTPSMRIQPTRQKGATPRPPWGRSARQKRFLVVACTLAGDSCPMPCRYTMPAVARGVVQDGL